MAEHVNDVVSRFPAKRLQDVAIHTADQLGRYAESYSEDALAPCAHFGLIAKGGNARGWWKLTPLGRDFLFRGARIYRRAWMFNGEVMRYEAPKVTADEIMGKAKRDAISLAEVARIRGDRAAEITVNR